MGILAGTSFALRISVRNATFIMRFAGDLLCSQVWLGRDYTVRTRTRTGTVLSLCGLCVVFCICTPPFVRYATLLAAAWIAAAAAVLQYSSTQYRYRR